MPCPDDSCLKVNNITGYSDDIKVSYMTDIVVRTLWHHCLNHSHFRRVSQMHKHVDGVPKIKKTQDTEGCATCWACKMRNSQKGSRYKREDATVVGQGIGMDFGFIVQKSCNKEQYDKFHGINGETAYLLLVDHFLDRLWGIATDGKAPPLAWLNRWLSQYRPARVPDRYAVMDCGGELANNSEVLQLLEYHTYTPRPTALDSSHPKGPVENPHQYIGATLRSMIKGGDLEENLWPYAFYHFLLVHKFMHHGIKGSPYTRITGTRGDLSRMRVFGCLCLVRPPGKRNGKLVNRATPGRFMGYTGTLCKIYYQDLVTKRIKTALSVKLDESGAGLGPMTPNTQQLRDALDGKLLPHIDQDTRAPSELGLLIKNSPFLELTKFTIQVCCDYPTFGIRVDVCSSRGRVYLTDMLPCSSGARLRGWRHNYVGAYIVEIKKYAIFTTYHFLDACAATRAKVAVSAAPFMVLTLPPERLEAMSGDVHPPHLHLDQFRPVIRVLYELGEGKKMPAVEMPTDDEIMQAISSVHDASVPCSTDSYAPETHPGTKWKRRQLLKFECWPKWQMWERNVMDAMHAGNMFGKPLKSSSLPADAVVLSTFWNYSAKMNGDFKARTCCDGCV
jgi:hypothetical protein